MKPILAPLSSFVQCQWGVAAVEFALIAPILLILLIGVFDFGMFINTQMRLENLSRSIAEYIIQGGEEDNVWDDVIVASGYFDDDGLETSLIVNTGEACECDDAGEIACDDACGTGEYKRHFIEVGLEMNYSPMIPYPGLTDNLVAYGSTRLQTQ